MREYPPEIIRIEYIGFNNKNILEFNWLVVCFFFIHRVHFKSIIDDLHAVILWYHSSTPTSPLGSPSSNAIDIHLGNCVRLHATNLINTSINPWPQKYHRFMVERNTENVSNHQTMSGLFPSRSYYILTSILMLHFNFYTTVLVLVYCSLKQVKQLLLCFLCLFKISFPFCGEWFSYL